MSGPNPWDIDDNDQNDGADVLYAGLHEDFEPTDPIPEIDDTPELASGTTAPAASPMPSSEDSCEYSNDETTLTSSYSEGEGDHPLLEGQADDENLALNLQAAISQARERVAAQRIQELTKQQRKLLSENQALRSHTHQLCFQLGHSQIDNAVLAAGQSVLMAQQHFLQTQESARVAREELQALAPLSQRMN